MNCNNCNQEYDHNLAYCPNCNTETHVPIQELPEERQRSEAGFFSDLKEIAKKDIQRVILFLVLSVPLLLLDIIGIVGIFVSGKFFTCLYYVVIISSLLYTVYAFVIMDNRITLAYQKKLTTVLPQNIKAEEMLNIMRQKGFTFPKMKALRLDENSTVAIAGGCDDYRLVMEDTILRVVPTKVKNANIKKSAKTYLEAAALNMYLWKFFVPDAPIDAYVFYQNTRRARLGKIFAGCVVALFILYLLGASTVASLRNALGIA